MVNIKKKNLKTAVLCLWETYYVTPWRMGWQPTPVFLPGESHGQRSLVGNRPRGRKESDTTERLWQNV